MVMLDGKYRSLLDVIEERRAVKLDNDSVAYYTREDNPTPDQPALFTLSPKQNIVFRASDTVVVSAPGTHTLMKQDHAAAFLPAEQWLAKSMLQVVFYVKWTIIHGLKPQRPLLVYAKDMTIPKQAAVEIV